MAWPPRVGNAWYGFVSLDVITADVTSVYCDATESLVMIVCIILARGFGCCQRSRVSGKLAQQMAET
jgi:hypothetical protein